MRTKKSFDCIEMTRHAERIYNQIANLTMEEQLSFWQGWTELLQKHQQTAKMRSKASAN